MPRALRRQPINLSFVDGLEQVAIGLHRRQVLANRFRVTLAWEATIGSRSRHKLSNEPATVRLCRQPSSERWAGLIRIAFRLHTILLANHRSR